MKLTPKPFRILLKVEPVDEKKNPPYHIYEYSRKTISDLLERHGFCVEKIGGTLPIPEFLAGPQDGETTVQKIVRVTLLGIYKVIHRFAGMEHCSVIFSTYLGTDSSKR